jgi:predicted O-methyltransferase YrrM
MTTLTSSRVASLLDRLFAEADATDRDIQDQLAALAPAERTRLMGDYAALYARAKENYLAVSRATGSLLYILARSSRAKSIVEFGTSFGVSTLHLAAALADNGGGRLVGTELEPTKAARARANLVEAGLADGVEIREGDALTSLSRDLPARIDLVLLDGAKSLYPRILALLEPHLGPGALVVADNADHSPELLARLRESGSYLSVPFAADVEVSIRL